MAYEVLEEESMLRERAFAMDLDDLHLLLKAFNKRGIHFASVHPGRPTGSKSSLLKSKVWRRKTPTIWRTSWTPNQANFNWKITRFATRTLPLPFNRTCRF